MRTHEDAHPRRKAELSEHGVRAGRHVVLAKAGPS